MEYLVVWDCIDFCMLENTSFLCIILGVCSWDDQILKAPHQYLQIMFHSLSFRSTSGGIIALVNDLVSFYFYMLHNWNLKEVGL